MENPSSWFPDSLWGIAIIPHFFGILPQIPCWDLLVASLVLHLFGISLQPPFFEGCWFNPFPQSKVSWELVVVMDQHWTGSHLRTGVGPRSDWVQFEIWNGFRIRSEWVQSEPIESPGRPQVDIKLRAVAIGNLWRKISGKHLWTGVKHLKAIRVVLLYSNPKAHPI